MNSPLVSTAADIVTFFVALLHFGFMHLEMNLWTTPRALKAFQMDPDFALKSKVLAANQGLYNGLFAVGLLYALMLRHLPFIQNLMPVAHGTDMGLQLQAYILLAVVVAGLYGAKTVSKRILFMQAIPALLAFCLLLLSRY